MKSAFEQAVEYMKEHPSTGRYASWTHDGYDVLDAQGHFVEHFDEPEESPSQHFVNDHNPLNPVEGCPLCELFGWLTPAVTA